MCGLNTKPRSCEPGKNTLNFLCDLFPLSRLSSTVLSYKTPNLRVGNASKIEPVQACHNSTEPFYGFEAEPHNGGSTRSEDAYD